MDGYDVPSWKSVFVSIGVLILVAGLVAAAILRVSGQSIGVFVEVVSYSFTVAAIVALVALLIFLNRRR